MTRQVAPARLRSILCSPFRAWLAAVAVAVAGCAVAWIGTTPVAAPASPHPSAVVSATVAGHAPEAALAGARKVYPYSVVPGGVRDRRELEQVLRTDKVVAVHYANFNAGAARPVQVDKPRAVHVSYRIGEQIYWTRKKVMLAAGETLLSDGKHAMRARCANRISDVAMAPVAASEPSSEVLDAAESTSAQLAAPVPDQAHGEGHAPAQPVTVAAATWAGGAHQQVSSRTTAALGQGALPVAHSGTTGYAGGPGQRPAPGAAGVDTVPPNATTSDGTGAPQVPTVLLASTLPTVGFVPGNVIAPTRPSAPTAPQPLTAGELPPPGTHPIPPLSADPDRPRLPSGEPLVAHVQPPPTEVPEPHSVVLVCVALAALGFTRRRTPSA